MQFEPLYAPIPYVAEQTEDDREVLDDDDNDDDDDDAETSETMDSGDEMMEPSEMTFTKGLLLIGVVMFALGHGSSAADFKTSACC